MRQVVSLSGGRDSTAMLLMMLEKGEQIDDILFFDWGMEFPQMYEHLDKLESYIGQKITRLYPPKPWEYWMLDHVKTKGKRKDKIGYGWPSPKIRWCTRIKYQECRKYEKGAISCIGYAYHERFSRARYRNGHRFPLLELGVTSQEALKYCEAHGFDFGGLYKLFNRVSCWCCPFQGRKEVEALRGHFPDLWSRMLDMASKCEFPLPDSYPLSVHLKTESDIHPVGADRRVCPKRTVNK